MQQIKELCQNGEIELGKLDSNNSFQKVEYSQLINYKNNQEKYAKILNRLKQLTWDQKYQWVHINKLKAKEIYKTGKYDKAIQAYLQSLLGIQLKEGTKQQQQQMKNELKLPILLNIATCLFMKNQFKKSLELCNNILTENPKYLSAIYKKIKLCIKLGYFNETKQLIKNGMQLALQLEQHRSYQQFYQLKDQLIKADQQHKSVYQKMFKNYQNNTNLFSQYNQHHAFLPKKTEYIEHDDEIDDDQILQLKDTPLQKLTKITANIKSWIQSCIIYLNTINIFEIFTWQQDK